MRRRVGRLPLHGARVSPRDACLVLIRSERRRLYGGSEPDRAGVCSARPCLAPPTCRTRHHRLDADRGGQSDDRWPGRVPALLRVAAASESGDVVGAVGNDPAQNLVVELLQRQVSVPRSAPHRRRIAGSFRQAHRVSEGPSFSGPRPPRRPGGQPRWGRTSQNPMTYSDRAPTAGVCRRPEQST